MIRNVNGRYDLNHNKYSYEYFENFFVYKTSFEILKAFFSSEFDQDFYENSSYEDIKILTVEIETNPDLSSGCRVRFENF